MKISIIIPVFNASAAINETLSHLFASHYNNFEVIIVDDASTDDSVEVAGRFPVKIVKLDRNSGAAAARNKGSLQAIGEILFFIDSDVWVKNNTLELIEKAFSDPHNPAAIIGAYTPEQPIASFYSHFQNFYTFYNHDKCQKETRGLVSWFWTACGAIKRDVFLKMDGFREIYTGASAEDMDLGYRLSDENYPIILDKKIEVTHAHFHSMKSILRNNFKKAAAWGELYLRKNIAGKYKHGFTSSRNYVTMLLVALSAIFLVISPFSFHCFMGLLLILFLIAVVNREFYHLIATKKDYLFAAKAFLFHIIATFAAGLGAIEAIRRKMIGKEGEKKNPD